MHARLTLRVLALAGACLLTFPIAAQQPRREPDREIGAAERAEVIEGTLRHLNTAYVFPEVAKKMEVAIRARAARKEYDSITSAAAFARALSDHLQEVSQDRHLRVLHSADPLPEKLDEPTPEERARTLEQARLTNFGFERVERLAGNVGYLDLRAFSGLAEASDTGVAAMNFLANTDALIIDLRRNGGGSPAMIGLISSYLFDGPVHLNDFYWRDTDETRQFWTTAHVQGRRYGKDKRVYVLTSTRTFSAAEEFTYNLKSLKRATIVGATTGGGAHPGGVRRVNEHFGVWVPAGRAINPVTKTNWEGTGIEPDIQVEEELALKTAHLDALKKLYAGEGNQRRKELLGTAIEEGQKELDALKAAAPRSPR